MPKKAIEAALFMAPKPLSMQELSKISGISSMGVLKEMLEDLRDEYAARGIDIVQTPEGWRMHVKPELLPKVSHLAPYTDMSDGCKRTLALVAYKEPVRQSLVIKMQGNKAYNYIKQLTKMGLLKAEKEGRTKRLSLTPEFERYFGQDKEAIKQQLKIRLLMQSGPSSQLKGQAGE